MAQTEQPTLSQSPEGETDSVSQTLSALVDQVEHQVKSFRDIHKHLKRLEKEIAREHKRLTKAPKTKRTVTQKPIKVNSGMQKFLSALKAESPNNDGCFTRQVMMRSVSSYIKDKNLQIEDNKKQWKPDATLCKLFDLDKKQNYTFMNINGLISRVVEQ